MYDPIGYMQTLVEMFAPGCNHKELNVKQLAQKVAHIGYARQEEAKRYK